LAETEKKLGSSLQREPFDQTVVRWASQELKHSHIGDYPQQQRGLNYIGASLPVGQITPKQMLRLADLIDAHGSGEIRLTVWQNFIIPNILDAFVPTVKKALEKMGLPARQSNLSSGVVACTGNTYCKFAQSNTKGHALELIKTLEKRIELDQPVNIHITGCPNSCAQHYIGDLGCLGTKARINGESVDAYHIFVGGGFGHYREIGRQIFTALSASELVPTIERILRVYLARRNGRGESFQEFTRRYDLRELQEIFTPHP